MKHILGVDIAKDKFDCCLLTGGGSLTTQCANSLRGFKALLRWLKNAEIQLADLHVCMEATGIYGEGLLQWLFAQGAAVSKVNPAQVKYFAKSRLARNKTDRVDALMIAEFCRAQTPRLWSPPAPELARLQGYTRLLAARKEQRASERRRAAMLPKFLRAHTGAVIRVLEREIEKLQEQIDEVVWGCPELRAKRQLLCSIPCVGKVTAQTVLAELPPQIQSARQAAAYAGLTPQREQSGQKEGRARLSKTGNPHLRSALYMPAVSGRSSNGRLKSCAARLKEKGKATKQIIGACMHLLMRLCYGVLASGRPFEADWLSRQPRR
jgi:transposase